MALADCTCVDSWPLRSRPRPRPDSITGLVVVFKELQVEHVKHSGGGFGV